MRKNFLHKRVFQALSLLLLVFVPFAFVGCGGGGGGGSGSGGTGDGGSGGNTTGAVNASYAKYLKSLYDKVIAPALTDYVTKAGLLRDKINALEAAAVADADLTNPKKDAQDAWRDAILSWESLELLQIGPAGAVASAKGGEGYRDKIYSWPTSSPCSIDQELVKNQFADAGYLASKLVNVYGLDALEYVLFTDTFSNACAAPVGINANGEWAALEEKTITLRRIQYAKVVAQKVLADSIALENSWSPEGGNFKAKFVNAGENKTVFATTAEAMDAVFAAMFYLDMKTKDKKMAAPFGLGANAGAGLKLSELEFDYKDLNREAILANLKIYKAIYYGGDSTDSTAFGIDDLLTEKQAASVATDLGTQINKMIAAFEGLPAFANAIKTENVAAFTDAYKDLKSVTDLMKEDLVFVLKLEVPKEGAGDND